EVLGTEVEGTEKSFLKFSPARKVGKGGGTWEFTVTLPRDSEAKKYQVEGFFEGKILLKIKTSAGEQPFPVRVKWVPPEPSEKPSKGRPGGSRPPSGQGNQGRRGVRTDPPRLFRWGHPFLLHRWAKGRGGLPSAQGG